MGSLAKAKEQPDKAAQTCKQKKQQVASYRREQRASVRQEQTPTLENLRGTISCTAYRVWGPIKSSFGPTIRLQRKMGFSRSSASVGLNFTFDPTHTNRETGVAVSLSANQGQYEMGVESNLSENGPEYAFTGQLHGFGNLRAGIEV
jgi:hypothetical protein